MENFGRELVKEENMAGNQNIPILLHLIATVPSYLSTTCCVIILLFLKPGMISEEWELMINLTKWMS